MMLKQMKRYVEEENEVNDDLNSEDNKGIFPIRKKNRENESITQYDSPRLKPIRDDTNPSLLCLNNYHYSHYTLSCPNSDNELKGTFEDSNTDHYSIKKMRKIMYKSKQTIHRVFSNNPKIPKSDDDDDNDAIHIDIFKDNQYEYDNFEDYVLLNEEDDCIIGEKGKYCNILAQKQDKDDAYRCDCTLSILEILNRRKTL